MTPRNASCGTPATDNNSVHARASETTLTKSTVPPLPASSNLLPNTLPGGSAAIAPAASLTKTTEPNFHRVLVRRPGATKNSTVSISDIDYKKLLRFAYGNTSLLHSALREAALRVELPAVQVDAYATITVQTRKRQDFSAAVRAKALKSLQGAYRPDIATKMAMTAEERVAAENNSAWSGV